MKDTYAFPDLAPTVRILQITDPHLFAERSGQLLGVNTTDSFAAVIEAIVAQEKSYDLILATGDLVQDHHREAYHCFAQLVKPLKQPLFWVAGNHDIQPQMGNALAMYGQIQPHKHILAGSHWQLILLDSHVFGIPSGELCQTELDFLAEKLTAYPERHSLIVLHHNILPTYSAWLDQHSLRNRDALAEVIKPFNNVKAILHGHIHQEVDNRWQGCQILATPSTCIQFRPHCHDFTLDFLSPGWREMTLYPHGQIKTAVRRLKGRQFLPDFSARGY